MTGIGMAVSVVLAALAGLLLAGLLNNKRMYENEAQALRDERAGRFIDRCDAARVRCERAELRERCKHLQETVRRCHDALEARRAQVVHLHREHREALDALNEVDEDRAHLLNERRRLLEELGCSCRGDDGCNFCQGHRPRPNDERGDSEDAANRRARHALDTIRLDAVYGIDGKPASGAEELTRISVRRLSGDPPLYVVKWWAGGSLYGYTGDSVEHVVCAAAKSLAETLEQHTSDFDEYRAGFDEDERKVPIKGTLRSPLRDL